MEEKQKPRIVHYSRDGVVKRIFEPNESGVIEVSSLSISQGDIIQAENYADAKFVNAPDGVPVIICRGVVADGVTDDTVALQRALDAAGKITPSGL